VVYTLLLVVVVMRKRVVAVAAANGNTPRVLFVYLRNTVVAGSVSECRETLYKNTLALVSAIILCNLKRMFSI
jgi:hypothetical protein